MHASACSVLQQQQLAVISSLWTYPKAGMRVAGCADSASVLTLFLCPAGSQPSSMAMGGKPDLKINIPNATAPELPYSQRPQAGGTDASRLQKVRRAARVDSIAAGHMAVQQGFRRLLAGTSLLIPCVIAPA